MGFYRTSTADWLITDHFRPSDSGRLKCSLKLCFFVFLIILISVRTLHSYYEYYAFYPFTYPDDNEFYSPPRVFFDGYIRNETKLLIIVNSRVDEFEQRSLIRKIYSQQEYRNDTQFLFLVGSKPKYESRIKAEQRTHRDVISTSIEEDYYNLAEKTLAMFLFGRRFYRNTHCLAKVDSDNFINITNLEFLCDSFKGDSLIAGFCQEGTDVERFWGSKWRIPYFVYPNKTYPLYCFGETYLFIGSDVPRRLLEELDNYGFYTSNNKRKMPEDYIYSGALAEMANIPRRHIPGFATQILSVKAHCLNGIPRTYSYHSRIDAKDFAGGERRMRAITQSTECPSDSLNINSE